MIEIERKFLVKDLSFLKFAVEKKRILQYYLDEEGKIRIRQIRDKYTGGIESYISVKVGETEDGLIRNEITSKIENDDFGAILGDYSLAPNIIKMRYVVRYNESNKYEEGYCKTNDFLFNWEIDVFEGGNRGLIIAEIEIDEPREVIDIPEWVGEEITGDKRYYNFSLAQYPYRTWKDEG